MFGKIELWIFAVSIISVAGAAMDLLKGRIYNWFTFPAMLAGCVYSIYLNGMSGGLISLLGIGLGFLMYIWMFVIRMMGGGDVKLLMAIGAWTSPLFTLQTGILGILVGGVLAAGILIAKRKLGQFGRKIYRFLLTIAVKELSLEKPAIDPKLTMPFGVPIAIAALWVILANPFEKMRGLPW